MKAELVFGLIAPLGASLRAVERELDNVLSSYGYRVETIHLGAIIAELYRDHYKNGEIGERLFKSPEGELARIRLLQDAGDALRIDAKRGDMLAIAATARIAALRKSVGDQPCAYLIRSLKHPAELELLRQIYGDQFYTISAFASRQRRVANLNIAMNKGDQGSVEPEMLVDRDYRRGHRDLLEDRLDPALAPHWFSSIVDERSQKELEAFGQQLQGTFYQADLFVDSSDDQLTKGHVRRLIELIFGNPFATPTKEEFAMFQARAVSLRSADLSRQVGAVIATKGGDIIASGANEVPRFGGGLHWAPSDLKGEGDPRDFHFYANGEIDALRMKNLKGVLKRLEGEGWSFVSPHAIDKTSKKCAVEHLARRLRELHISQMGDYGRTVHAEMAALMDAVSRGVCVRGQIAYVTTFPCHQCAKHLIAAGIRQVIFIEPYPKSETVKLWPSEVANFEADETAPDDRMHLLPFVGIAPRRYGDFFLLNVKKSPRRVEKEGVRRVAEWKLQSPQVKVKQEGHSENNSLTEEEFQLNYWKERFN